MIDSLSNLEDNIILEIYKQRLEHLRHLQQMRATYFNLYIVVIGFSVAAIVSIYGDFQDLPVESTLLICGLVWFISIITLMRAERWGGHISHDICAIRRIQNHYATKFQSVAKIIPYNPNPLKSLEFDRPLWDRNRSIETPISLIGAIFGGIFIAYALSLDYWWENILIGFILIIIPIGIWRLEVSHLKKRHEKCCLSEINQE